MNDHSNEKPYAVLTMGPLWHSTVLELHSSGLSMDNNGEVAAALEGTSLLTENRVRILGILQKHNGISRTELAKSYSHL